MFRHLFFSFLFFLESPPRCIIKNANRISHSTGRQKPYVTARKREKKEISGLVLLIGATGERLI